MEVAAFAPATIGNIGIGFDVMGLCLPAPADVVIARKGSKRGLHIRAIRGVEGIPLAVDENTAGVAALALLKHLGAEEEAVELELHKQIPLSSGMGGSAASAVAAVVAINELWGGRCSKEQLFPFALSGEFIATRSSQADNVAPSLFGGMVLALPGEAPVHLPLPSELTAVIVHPRLEILTTAARAVLSEHVPLSLMVRQTGHIAAFVHALHRADYSLIQRVLDDVVIEPQRAGLIPGFYRVKEAALGAGALGSSISGGGPAVFALCRGTDCAALVAQAMVEAFEKVGLAARSYSGLVNPTGAGLLV
jgi:homoserine kinase